MTRSARLSSSGGIATPVVPAVLRLNISICCVRTSIGNSPGLAPPKIFGPDELLHDIRVVVETAPANDNLPFRHRRDRHSSRNKAARPAKALRLFLHALYAIGTERLAGVAVEPLRIGLLGAFDRLGTSRRLGGLYPRRRLGRGSSRCGLSGRRARTERAHDGSNQYLSHGGSLYWSLTIRHIVVRVNTG
jgi:hypothetical protein